MTNNRRQFFGLLGAGLVAGRGSLGASSSSASLSAQHDHAVQTARAASPLEILPVQTPDVPKLPWNLDNGVKVFHLVAEPVKCELVPGRSMDAWGYNGSVPGPTVEITQGDRVRLIVDNHLPEPTSMHWHGFEIPIEMDGVGGISQPLIPPGGRFVYEFTLHQAGTFFYHSHMAMQEMMGLIGLFIMHPREPLGPRVDRDFGLVLQEWAILPGNTVPNTMSMEFNWLTLNGKSGPATTPLIVKLGDRVRIRLVNMGMDHHPIHLHGNTFYVTGTEAGRVPQAAWTPANTVLVGVAQARDIEFDAKYPGAWMLHCHMPHHMMNQMSSMVGPMMESGRDLPAGMGMEEGMGMLQQSGALSAENGPSLGRSIGIGAEHEKATTNTSLGDPQANAGMGHRTDVRNSREAQNTVRQPSMSPAQMTQANASSDPWRVPGYPQDMAMSMSMPMDQMLAKPETDGLPRGWSAEVMGMMTLVRVLPADLYEKVKRRASDQGSGARD
jgi:FtsP/CotA-like multicopper oxidase with cupredoxin domain